jgi:hypothetical protein
VSLFLIESEGKQAAIARVLLSNKKSPSGRIMNQTSVL